MFSSYSLFFNSDQQLDERIYIKDKRKISTNARNSRLGELRKDFKVAQQIADPQKYPKTSFYQYFNTTFHIIFNSTKY